MAATIEAAYRNAAAITITLDGLANNAARRSASVAWSSIKDLDAQIFVQVNSASAATSATGYVSVYLYEGIYDGTTTLWETGGNTDAAYTLRGDEKFLMNIAVIANSTIYGGMWQFGKHGLIVPRQFGIIVANFSGATLPTDADNLAQYAGIGIASV